MIRQYIQQALYHLRDNPIITWVSLLGTAMSICMIMVVVITLRARVADCPPEVNRDRTLYVTAITARQKGTTGGGINSYPSVQTGRECFKALTIPETVTLYARVEKVRVSLPVGNQLTADMRQVDTDFWRVFSFKFIDGKPFSESDFQSALPMAVVSASVARRLYGRTEGVVGQYLQLNRVEFQVSGVVADVSMLADESYAQIWIPYTAGNAEANTWGANLMGPMRVAILARHRGDFDAIREECEQLCLKYNAGQPDYDIYLNGQPDTQFTHLYRSWNKEPDTRSAVIRYIAVLLVLLIVPAINLSGMTHSRMQRRMAEVGVRKAFGATGGELLRQVFVENLLLTVIAGLFGLLLSYGATFLLNGYLFGSSVNAYLSGETTLTASQLLSPWIFLSAFGFCLIMNILSSCFPAWRASRMNIVDAINQGG